jgi:EmrB/QacA subfamily drug resistance transporter
VTTLGIFMASLDSNIVTIALPKISLDLSAGFAYLAWVVTGYLVALVALVIFFGKMADVYGRKRIYITGFVLFGASSALCGLSQNITELIAFRIIQGGSAALFYAVSRPILLDAFPANEISFAFGVNTATSSIGAVLGPVVGGLLVGIDWRLIFYVNVPIAIVASALAIRNIPPGLKRISLRSALKSFNPLNTGLFVLVISLVMVWLTFYSPIVGVIGLVSLLLLIVSERRSSNPMVNRELRANRGFVYALLAIIMLSIGYGGISFAMSFYFQSVVNLKAALSGILLAPISLTVGIGSVGAGRIYDRSRNPLLLSIVGALICGVAMVILGLDVGFEAQSWIIESTLAVTGFAVGIYWVPLITAAMRFARTEIIGTASATITMFAQMTSAISITLTVAISAFFLPHSLATQVYSGGLVNLSSVDANLFKRGIEYSLIVLGAFNLASIPLILEALKEHRTVHGIASGRKLDTKEGAYTSPESL